MVQATWPCGPYNPADLRVFPVSVVENDTVWNLWQAPVGGKKNVSKQVGHGLNLKAFAQKRKLEAR